MRAVSVGWVACGGGGVGSHHKAHNTLHISVSVQHPVLILRQIYTYYTLSSQTHHVNNCQRKPEEG